MLEGLLFADAGSSKGRYRKALGFTMIKEDLSLEDKLKLVKDVGFEGIEIPTQLLNKRRSRAVRCYLGAPCSTPETWWFVHGELSKLTGGNS
jgi:hypothetical protein